MPSKTRRSASPRSPPARRASTACRSACKPASRTGIERVTPEQTSDILGFWFSHGWDQWWKADPAFDDEIRRRFLALWETARENVPEHFLGDPDSAVAAVLLFDQFPRNMFRG